MTTRIVNQRRRLWQFLAPCACLALTCLFSAAARADGGIDGNAVEKARGFLEVKERGGPVCDFLHFGSTYHGRNIDKDTMLRRVNGADGKTIPGAFALLYEYTWGDNGSTTVAFIFNAKGNFDDLRVLDTNAGPLNQPFALANLTIQVVGQSVFAILKDNKNVKPEDLKQIKQLVDNADAKGLLIQVMKLEQALGL